MRSLPVCAGVSRKRRISALRECGLAVRYTQGVVGGPCKRVPNAHGRVEERTIGHVVRARANARPGPNKAYRTGYRPRRTGVGPYGPNRSDPSLYLGLERRRRTRPIPPCRETTGLRGGADHRTTALARFPVAGAQASCGCPRLRFLSMHVRFAFRAYVRGLAVTACGVATEQKGQRAQRNRACAWFSPCACLRFCLVLPSAVSLDPPNRARAHNKNSHIRVPVFAQRDRGYTRQPRRTRALSSSFSPGDNASEYAFKGSIYTVQRPRSSFFAFPRTRA